MMSRQLISTLISIILYIDYSIFSRYLPDIRNTKQDRKMATTGRFKIGTSRPATASPATDWAVYFATLRNFADLGHYNREGDSSHSGDQFAEDAHAFAACEVSNRLKLKINVTCDGL